MLSLGRGGIGMVLQSHAAATQEALAASATIYSADHFDGLRDYYVKRIDLELDSEVPGLGWSVHGQIGQGGIRAFIPLWIPLLFALLPTAYAWYRCRPPKAGHCPKCGYNLAGNATGVYPECGVGAGVPKT